MIEKAIVQLLLANPTVARMAGQRIYPAKAPQKPTYPYLVYQRDDADHQLCLSGPAGIASADVQIVVYCTGRTEYADAKALTDAIRSLNGFRGMAGGFRIQGMFLQNDRDEYQAPINADEWGIQGVPSEFKVWFNE